VTQASWSTVLASRQRQVSCVSKGSQSHRREDGEQLAEELHLGGHPKPQQAGQL